MIHDHALCAQKIEKFEIRPGAEALGFLRSAMSLRRLERKSSTNEFKFFVDLSGGLDRTILNLGVFEKAILAIISEVCTRAGYTDQLIDIGANIGNHSVSLASLFKRVVAIEPNPVIFRVLEANLMRNNKENVSCHNIGLADMAGNATLVAPAKHHGLGKVKDRSTLKADSFKGDVNIFDIEREIQLESTSAFFDRHVGKDCKTFIKIDVEGMEQEILNQLVPYIRAEEPIVGFEWYVQQQLGIKDIIASLPNYTTYLVQSNDEHMLNPLLKAASLLIRGRKFSILPYNPQQLREAYSLVLLVPSRVNLLPQ